MLFGVNRLFDKNQLKTAQEIAIRSLLISLSILSEGRLSQTKIIDKLKLFECSIARSPTYRSLNSAVIK